MATIAINRPGQFPIEVKAVRARNRTGATLVIGDVVAFDATAADAATRALQGVNGVMPTLTDAIFANVVDPATPRFIGVVTKLLGPDNTGIDDAEVEVQISGLVFAKVGGTNWESPYSSNGVLLKVDTASSGSNRRFVAAAPGITNESKIGMIMENIAEDLSAANKQQTAVLLLGWGILVGDVAEPDTT